MLALEATALIILVLLFFVRVPQVSGHSMEPQLRADEHVLINTLAYAMRLGDGDRPLVDFSFHPIARGDVIAFVHASDDGRAVYLKRVVGVPGDRVNIEHGVVWVNGARLDEPYVSLRDGAGLPATTVPHNAFFVLGDNRGESDDSRAFGAVPESAVIGRAAFVVWPLNRAGPIR
jgi:signal peptidase I